MIKVYKWLWGLAHQRALDRVRFEVRSLSDYHRRQSEVAYLRDKYEPRQDDRYDMIASPFYLPLLLSCLNCISSSRIICKHL